MTNDDISNNWQSNVRMTIYTPSYSIWEWCLGRKLSYYISRSKKDTNGSYHNHKYIKKIKIHIHMKRSKDSPKHLRWVQRWWDIFGNLIPCAARYPPKWQWLYQWHPKAHCCHIRPPQAFLSISIHFHDSSRTINRFRQRFQDMHNRYHIHAQALLGSLEFFTFTHLSTPTANFYLFDEFFTIVLFSKRKILYL